MASAIMSSNLLNSNVVSFTAQIWFQVKIFQALVILNFLCFLRIGSKGNWKLTYLIKSNVSCSSNISMENELQPTSGYMSQGWQSRGVEGASLLPLFLKRKVSSTHLEWNMFYHSCWEPSVWNKNLCKDVGGGVAKLSKPKRRTTTGKIMR